MNENNNKFTYTTQGTQSLTELRKHLNEALGKFAKCKQEFENKETGLKASITQRDINKMSSKEAIEKSTIGKPYTKEEHFKIAEDIGNLFENATLKATHADSKQRPNVANVHRFNIDIEVNTKDAITKITILERIEGENRIYAMELQTNPPQESFRVLEAEMAKSTQPVGTPAHTEMPTIADFGNDIVSQDSSDCQAQDNSDSADSNESTQTIHKRRK